MGKERMTEAQVRVFLLSAEVGSVAKASELLFVSQPAVSKHLSLLEKELDLVLFERSRTGLHLTAGGRILRDYLQSISCGLTQTLEKARAANFEALNQFRVGSREGWNIAAFFPATASIIRERYPGINISLHVLRENDLVDNLFHSNLDFILTTRRSLKQRKDLTCYKLATIGCGLLFSAQHPLANKHDLCLRDFKNDAFWVISEHQQDKKMANTVRERCKSCGFEPEIATASSVASAYSMIQYNHGVILVAEWSMARFNPLFRFMPIDVTIDVVACWIHDSRNALKTEVYNEMTNRLRPAKIVFICPPEIPQLLRFFL
jgi:DNA-binding transcriptional LysR family regulator